MLVAVRAVIASQKPIVAAGRDIDLMQTPGVGAKRTPAITAEVLEMQHDPPWMLKIARKNNVRLSMIDCTLARRRSEFRRVDR